MTDWKGRLRQARSKKGLSQDALGVAVGLSQTAIFSYEKGPNQVDIPTLEKLAGALDVTPEWIAFGHICPEIGSPDDMNPRVVRAVARAMVTTLDKFGVTLPPDKFAANLIGFIEQSRDDPPEAIAARVEKNLGFVKP
jgi:transcriptional regulator with XRE-family HTH domain